MRFKSFKWRRLSYEDRNVIPEGWAVETRRHTVSDFYSEYSVWIITTGLLTKEILRVIIHS